MDLRGAGNILGEEQSGHIREVGFELYQQMLEETLARLRAGEAVVPEADDTAFSPQINLGVPILIPESYVPDLDVRLELYRRLGRLETRVEFEGFAAELIDRFGPLPREVNTLLVTLRIKAECKKAHIARLDAGPKGATLQFFRDRFPNPAGLAEFLAAENGSARVRDNKLIVARAWGSEAQRVKGVFELVRTLARIAEAKDASPEKAATAAPRAVDKGPASAPPAPGRPERPKAEQAAFAQSPPAEPSTAKRVIIPKRSTPPLLSPPVRSEPPRRR